MVRACSQETACWCTATRLWQLRLVAGGPADSQPSAFCVAHPPGYTAIMVVDRVALREFAERSTVGTLG